VDIPDAELVRQLTARDGPLALRYRPHREDGVCRFAALYAEKGRPCPWCEAQAQQPSDK
jgi:hypothetical protein